MNIFISYRRKEEKLYKGFLQLYNFLMVQYGETGVFLDTSNIPVGIDFRVVISKELDMADIVLVLIGEQWINFFGEYRGNSKYDYVRFEIEYALKKGIQIVPVLFGKKTELPKENDLPDSIKSLIFFNSFSFKNEETFEEDLEKLSDSLDKLYNRFEIKATVHGGHVPRPKIHFENKDFRNNIEKKAKEGNAQAQFALAEYIIDICMYMGDWVEALQWYEKAANQGFIPAMYRLGKEYEKGYHDPFHNRKVKKELLENSINLKLAAFWYRKAVETLFERKRTIG